MNDIEAQSSARKASGFEESRLLHTMIRVRDLDKSLDFYTRLLGMRLLHKKEYPTGEFTLAFVGYGDEKETSVIELTYNWPRKESYRKGPFGFPVLPAKW